jgi:2,6-dihydroxypyridine 3-monooxygenase
LRAFPRVLVAGGSIGGLTAAILLTELGCEVDVYERSPHPLRDRGAGIVVLPVTERYFVERGGEERRVSLRLEYWRYLDRAGRVIASDPDGYRFTGWSTLYRALLVAFGEGRYHLGTEMVGFEPAPSGVVLKLGDGSTVEGDLLVCADGVASTARSILIPEVTPRYSGYVAWRGVTDEAALSKSARADLADAMLYQVLDHSHILAYAIPGDDDGPGTGSRQVNSVWYRNAPIDGAFESLMTDRWGERRTWTVPPGAIDPGHFDEMRSAAVEQLAPTLAEVVTGARETLIQAVVDLESPRLVFGRVCLMGDAAFVARPHLAAGQAKACADAWALRDAIERSSDLDEALAEWDKSQLALGRAVVARAREMGNRSQVEGTMVPGDPTWKFGLVATG